MIDAIDPASLAWRKSSYSDSGGECVETAVVPWRKSSYSEGAGECVETAILPERRVALRHSKRPDGAILLYTAAEWDAFLKGVKDGEFDIG